jgi:uncharacterized repeat protein (TIGR01451 family)
MEKKFFGFCLFLMFILIFVTPVLALGAPGNFKVTASPGNKVSISWDKTAGAAGYNVYRKAEGETSDFTRLNFSLINALSYEDRDVVQGGNYEYQVTAVDTGGIESAPSALGSAPYMSLQTVVTINHPGDAPVEIKSIVTGQPVSMAAPGDIIQYKIILSNSGYGKAANVAVTYPVPPGTRLILSSVDPNHFNASLEYYDSRRAKWLTRSEVEDAKDITRVRFKILDPVLPRASGSSGYVSFQVLIET